MRGKKPYHYHKEKTKEFDWLYAEERRSFEKGDRRQIRHIQSITAEFTSLMNKKQNDLSTLTSYYCIVHEQILYSMVT